MPSCLPAETWGTVHGGHWSSAGGKRDPVDRLGRGRGDLEKGHDY